MRILYIITRSIPGDAQSHVLELVRGFIGANDIGVVSGEDGFLCDEAARLGAATFIAPELGRSISPQRDISAAAHVQEIIEEFSPDVVHAHCSKAGLVGRFAAWRAKVPSVYTAHGWRFAPGVALAERLVAWPGEWLGARLGQHVITVSRCELNLARRFGIASASEVTLIYNGISDSHRRYRNDIHPEVKMVMVARFAPPKDQLSVMRALQGLPAQVRLAFVGDGPTLTQMQAKAIDLGLQDRVTFLGSRLDVADILAESNLFVLSSHSEGLPISILEALRAGLPVVTTDAGGVRDCVHHGITGLVVPRNDVVALREAIATMVASPALRARMGEAGCKLYERQFTAEHMVLQTRGIYQRLVQQAPKRAVVTPLEASFTRTAKNE